MPSLAVAVLTAIALGSCASASAPRPTVTTDATSLAEFAEEQLLLPGVETVLAGQNEVSGASAAADPWNPDLWAISIGVTMAAEATLNEVVAAAEATHDFSEQYSGAGRWSAQLYAGGPAGTVIEDTTAIIAVAAAYPQADVALEAPLEGEQWPQLYLNHVATDEAAVITAMLTWSPLAAEPVDGYAVPYFMRVSAPDGQTDVSGLIGD